MTGLIVRFRHPDTDFDAALKAGQEHAMEHFAAMIGGLNETHVEELERLDFFNLVSGAIGIDVRPGLWLEIKPGHLPDLEQILSELAPASQGLQNLIDDLRKMVAAADEANCSIGFML